MAARISGLAVVETAAGFVLLWSGIRGATVGQTLRSFLKGENPPAVSEAPPTVGVISSGTGGSSSSPGGATGSAIADDALKYKGHPYLYGGAPGRDGKSPWDCSSFCNWVLGHDMGITLPGGVKGYDGLTHGPATGSYLLAWAKYRVKGGTAGNAAAGDLCVWQTHMGIAIGGGNMISALDEQLGTRVTSIHDGAPPGEIVSIIRVP